MRSYSLMAGILFVLWLAAAAWLVQLFMSGRSDLGAAGDAIVIAALGLCTVYIAVILWKRRPAGERDNPQS
ncbi:MAG TPA: hypothetical protein VNA29_06225 [Sphingomicrobium sp.]|nr:hypothetical protein [Sphingomicrobium sp.]